MQPSETFWKVFAGIGIASAVIVFVVLAFDAFDALRGVVRDLHWQYKYKHRFDKQPTAKCYCKDCKLCGQDGETPAFTTDKRLAMEYDDHYHASNFLTYLEHRLEGETGIENLRVTPLYMAYMTKEQVNKLFDAIFRDDDVSGCGQAFSPDAEGRESE